MNASKHERTGDAIRKLIGTMEVGTKLPSVAKLSQNLKVSQGTVLRAIEGLIDEGLVERRPNRGAFVSRPGLQTRTIGVIWTDIVEQVTGEPLTKHPYTSATLHALQEEAAKLGRNILLTSNMDPDTPEFIGRNGEVAGVIILHNHDARLVEAYSARGIPAVLVDPLNRPHGVPFVTTDHYAEFREATRHLLNLGHERVLMLAVKRHLSIPSSPGPKRSHNFIVEERIRGFTDTMAAAGCGKGAPVLRVGRAPWRKAEEDALRGVLKGTTACLCFNDDVAAWFLGFCRREGLRVPEDISVMGHDDTGLASRLMPSLSTIHAPLEAMGCEAVRLLVQHIEEEDITGHGVVLPGQVVERASTQAPLDKS